MSDQDPFLNRAKPPKTRRRTLPNSVQRQNQTIQKTPAKQKEEPPKHVKKQDATKPQAVPAFKKISQNQVEHQNNPPNPKPLFTITNNQQDRPKEPANPPSPQIYKPQENPKTKQIAEETPKIGRNSKQITGREHRIFN